MRLAKRFDRKIMSSLSGLKVLDLTSHLSGPYCTMILADHGADIVKVERPDGGDPLRHSPPFQKSESAPFMLWNRNKRSIVLDLKDADDLTTVKKMAEKADVLVENFKPGTVKRLGLGYDVISPKNPGLIYCSISGFGQTGPYASRGGFDLIANAMSGLMSINGPADGAPFRIPVPVSDLCAGMNAAMGVLLALFERQNSGVGQYVDTSLFEAGLSLGVYEAASVFANGEVPERLGQAHRGSAPYQMFQTSDGYITVGAAQENFWIALCKLLGCEHLLNDTRYQTKKDRVEHHVTLFDELSPYFKKYSTDEIWNLLDGAGIPAGPVLNHVEVLKNPQTIARDMVKHVKHPKLGAMKTLGAPVKLSKTPAQVSRAAPMLGEHDSEVLSDWGIAKSAKPEV